MTVFRVRIQVWAGWAAVVADGRGTLRRVAGPASFDLAPGERFRSFTREEERQR